MQRKCYITVATAVWVCVCVYLRQCFAHERACMCAFVIVRRVLHVHLWTTGNFTTLQEIASSLATAMHHSKYNFGGNNKAWCLITTCHVPLRAHIHKYLCVGVCVLVCVCICIGEANHRLVVALCGRRDCHFATFRLCRVDLPHMHIVQNSA